MIQEKWDYAREELFDSLVNQVTANTKALIGLWYPQVIFDFNGRQFMLNSNQMPSGARSILEIGKQIKVIFVGDTK